MRQSEVALAVATGLAGSVMVGNPSLVSRTVEGRGTPPAPGIVRLLGSRYLAQSAAQLMLPQRSTFAASAAVDVLHAASMLAAAALPRYRSAAAFSFALATVSAAANSAVASRRAKLKV